MQFVFLLHLGHSVGVEMTMGTIGGPSCRGVVGMSKLMELLATGHGNGEHVSL